MKTTTNTGWHYPLPMLPVGWAVNADTVGAKLGVGLGAQWATISNIKRSTPVRIVRPVNPPQRCYCGIMTYGTDHNGRALCDRCAD